MYDAFIGARVGAIVGALLGAILTALTTPIMAWTILAGAALGGPAGYLWERHTIEAEHSNSTQAPLGD